jgi:hypothetical protein
MKGIGFATCVRLSPTTQTKKSVAMDILLREDDLKVSLEQDKHSPVVCAVEIVELHGMRINEPILSKDLGERVPAP